MLGRTEILSSGVAVKGKMAESQKSHVRQHYIPQFILKNFCHDKSKNEVFFFKVGESECSSEFVSNVFMEKYLYAKEENPVEVEESLANFEKETAPLFKKFCQDPEISLTIAEDESLRLFLSLLAFRAANTRNQFANNMSEGSKALYRGNRGDVDMKDLWLENVHLLSRHRTIKGILDDSGISNYLKIFIITEFSGFYMCLLERRGNVDFHISDCYPVVMNGETEAFGKVVNLPIYYFFPISDSRIIVLVTNQIENVSRGIANLDFEKKLKGPKGSPDRTHMIFRPEKVYFPEVEWMNKMIIENAKEGVVVKDLDRCSKYL